MEYIDILTPQFWTAVVQIIMIDILLGGDNAVVIALECRDLQPRQRFKGILWGTFGAILLRVLLISFAMQLLEIPFLKLVGAILLLWIGIKLLLPEHDDTHGKIKSSDRLWAAVRTVIIADFVMSLDNVIAIAGAAQNVGGKHEIILVIFGLAVSIPVIVWGSQLIIKLMERFPIIITLGAMLLGWIAGHMAYTEPMIAPHLPNNEIVGYAFQITGALLVLMLGRSMAGHRLKQSGHETIIS